VNAESQAAARWLAGVGCPAVTAEDATGPGLQLTAAIERARDATAKGACFVVLSGDVGMGKSVAAATWLLERARAVANGAPVSEWPRWGRWIHAHQLARLNDLDGRGIGDLEACPLLVLDDLGAEFLDGKGWLSAALDSLVYQRHGNRRPSMLTTNLPAAAFLARYGGRIGSRLRECAAFVELAGVDLRRPAGARS